MNYSHRLLELQKDFSLSSSVLSLASKKNFPRKVEKLMVWEEEGRELGTTVRILLCVRHSAKYFAFIDC